MRKTKSKTVLGTAFVILLIIVQADFRQKSLLTVVPAVSFQLAALTDLHGASCFPPAGPADLAEMVDALVSFEKSLAENKSPRVNTLIELARRGFHLGEAAEEHERRQWYEKGIHYAEILISEQPGRVEGHYWRALNLCGICEISKAAEALSMLPEIIKILKSAIAIDQTYNQGGPLRVLGRILGQAPPWPISEGDPAQSLILLRLATGISPDNSTNHLYLAETLIDQGESEEACIELSRALSARCNHSSPSRLEEDREQATALMTECGSKSGKNALEVEKNIARR